MAEVEVTAVETEATKVEASVEAEVKKVEAEAKAVEEKVVEEVKKVRVDITAEEKVLLRDAETDFLRAQVTIRDLQMQMKDAMAKSEAASKKYAGDLDNLVKKYGINKAEMLFDNIENAFKAVAKKL